MSESVHQFSWRWLVALLAVGFVAPSAVIFALETSLAEKTVVQAISEIARRQFAQGENLFLLAAIGLVPFVVLDAALWLVYITAKDRSRMSWLAIAGLVGVLALMLPAHVAVWLPLYTHSHMSSTAVIAFLFIPFYCCVSMAIGLGVGEWLFRRHRQARVNRPLQPSSGGDATR